MVSSASVTIVSELPMVPVIACSVVGELGSMMAFVLRLLEHCMLSILYITTDQSNFDTIRMA